MPTIRETTQYAVRTPDGRAYGLNAQNVFDLSDQRAWTEYMSASDRAEKAKDRAKLMGLDIEPVIVKQRVTVVYHDIEELSS